MYLRAAGFCLVCDQIKVSLPSHCAAWWLEVRRKAPGKLAGGGCLPCSKLAAQHAEHLAPAVITPRRIYRTPQTQWLPSTRQHACQLCWGDHFPGAHAVCGHWSTMPESLLHDHSSLASLVLQKSSVIPCVADLHPHLLPPFPRQLSPWHPCRPNNCPRGGWLGRSCLSPCPGWRAAWGLCWHMPSTRLA